MERICEPELMDDPFQAHTYAHADFEESDRAFTAHILALVASRPQGSPVGKILDLGCGPGNITFLLGEALPQTPVLGLDGAEAMLALAEERKAKKPERWAHVHFQQALLPLAARALETTLPAPIAPPYDLIVSNSLLHHLHDPAVLWHTVRALGGPETLVVVRDLRRPPNPETLEELVAQHAAAFPPVLRRDYANSLAAAFLPHEVEAQLAAAQLGALRVAPLEDQYLDVWGPLPS